MKIYTLDTKITDLEAGDQIVCGNEMMEADILTVETVTHEPEHEFSIVNGSRICRCGGLH